MLKYAQLVGCLALLLSACAVPVPTPTIEPPTQTARIVTATRPATPTSVPSPSATLLATLVPTMAWTPTRLPSATPSPLPATFPTPAVTPTLLGGCAEIWQTGFYKMYADVKTSLKRFDCMIVQASDVVIDCDGHTIEGLNKQGHGFWIRKYGFPFLQTPNNIEIRNCKVTNARDGVFAEAGTNLYIHDNDFSNNFDDTNKDRFGIFLGMTEGGGIRLDNVIGARIERNTVNNSAIGIDVRHSENVVIRNNTAVNNSAWGVNLLHTTKSEVSNNTLQDNVRWCAWGSGVVDRGCDAAAIILQDGASYNLIKGNAIIGQNANGIFIKAHGVRCGDYNRIEGNKLIDAVYNAIEFSFCQGNQVIGNEISGSFDGVWFGFSAYTEVRDNIIRNMRNHGIISYNSRESVVTGNQVINAREGIYFFWDDEYQKDPKRFYFLTPTADQFASRNNLIEGNTLRDNAVAGIRLTNSIQNRIRNNVFINNGKNIWVEGKTEGNVIAGP